MIDEQEFVICLPFPPSVNSILGKRWPDAFWVECKERAHMVALSLADGKPFKGGLEVSYLLVKNDLRRYDIRNMVKCLDDGFNNALWVDDYQIDRAIEDRDFIDPELEWGGSVYIYVREVREVPKYDQDYAKYGGRTPKKKRRYKAK